jgi:hypothetical protein
MSTSEHVTRHDPLNDQLVDDQRPVDQNPDDLQVSDQDPNRHVDEQRLDDQRSDVQGSAADPRYDDGTASDRAAATDPRYDDSTVTDRVSTTDRDVETVRPDGDQQYADDTVGSTDRTSAGADDLPQPQATGSAAGTSAPASSGSGMEDPERLVPVERADSYGTRWNEVKGMFVDEPRQAVAQADALVGELLEELERLFSEQRRGIEQGLDNDDTSTEDLRMALRRYRSFFDRLLSL